MNNAFMRLMNPNMDNGMSPGGGDGMLMMNQGADQFHGRGWQQRHAMPIGGGLGGNQAQPEPNPNGMGTQPMPIQPGALGNGGVGNALLPPGGGMVSSNPPMTTGLVPGGVAGGGVAGTPMQPGDNGGFTNGLQPAFNGRRGAGYRGL